MKKQFDPRQMTLGQFLLFLVIGGIAVIWLCFEVNMRLHPSIDPGAMAPETSVSQPASETVS